MAYLVRAAGGIPPVLRWSWLPVGPVLAVGLGLTLVAEHPLVRLSGLATLGLGGVLGLVTLCALLVRKAHRAWWRRGEQRLRTLLEKAPVAFCITDEQGRYETVNDAYCAFCGYTSAELIGQHYGLIVPAARRAQAAASAVHRFATRDESPRELTVMTRSGQTRTVLSKSLLVPGPDGHPKLATFAVDLTDRKQVEERLAYLTRYDLLTGLPNRESFTECLAQALTRAGGRQRALAVLFLDVDRLQVLNDSLGHSLGDQLLVVIGQRLRGCLRPLDTLARFGSDEFTILLEDLNEVGDALRVAERVQTAMQLPIKLKERELLISASIGLSISPPVAADASEILRAAALALAQAKAQGGARHILFESETHATVLARWTLEADLRQALAREQLRVVHQPIVELTSGRLRGWEALMRWAHPERGLLPPSEFIPLAEELGLIRPLGRWLLTEACQRACRWSVGDPSQAPLSLSVNLSVQQLRDAQFVQTVAHALQQSGLDPRRLVLEITESELMEAAEVNVAPLRRLKALGVQLALDDFGTGYSSLSYLKCFPLDHLKLDRSFVAGLGQGAEDTAIVHAILTLAQTLGLQVTAEGVETADQIRQLQALGCTLGQGYLFAPLLPEDQAAALVSQASRRRGCSEAVA